MKHLIVEELRKSGLNQADAERQLKGTTEAIAAVARATGTARVPGFGTFKRTVRADRQGRNPATGEAIHIPSRVALTFKQAKDLVV